MTNTKTILAYRCPGCGSMIKSMPGAFALSGNMKRLKCPCGQSELTVELMNEEKYKLTVPCIACPRPHTYTISQNLFFGNKVLKVPCQLSGMDICFIGPEDKVNSQVEEEEKKFKEELGNHSFEEIQQNGGEENYLDPQILDMLTYTVHELNDEEAITCHCLQGEGEYEVTITEKGIKVTCQKCDASREIIVNSLSEAEDFLHSDVLHLN